MERPHAVHALRGHEFGMDVLVTPPGAYGDDVIMTSRTLVEVVHEVHFLVEFSVTDIEDGAPVGFVFNDRDFCQGFGPLTGRASLCNGLRQTCGGFDLIGKRGDVGGRMDAPCTVGEHPKRHAKFLTGNGSFKDAVSHGHRRFGQRNDTDLRITCSVGGGCIKCLSNFFLVEVPP